MTRYTSSRQKKATGRRAATTDTWVTCHCGKRIFPSRKTARAAAKTLRRSAVNATRDPDVTTLRAYPACGSTRSDVRGWHFGHKPHQQANLNDPRLRFVS